MPESIHWRTRPPRRRRAFVVLAFAAIMILYSRTALSYYVTPSGCGRTVTETYSGKRSAFNGRSLRHFSRAHFSFWAARSWH